MGSVSFIYSWVSQWILISIGAVILHELAKCTQNIFVFYWPLFENAFKIYKFCFIKNNVSLLHIKSIFSNISGGWWEWYIKFCWRRWGSSLMGLRCACLTLRLAPHQHQRNFFGANVSGGKGKWVYSSLIHSVAIVLCSWKHHMRVGFWRTQEERLGGSQHF